MLWTKAQGIRNYIFHIKFKWLCTVWNLLWTKAQKIRNYIFNLRLNDSILCKICYEQRHKLQNIKIFNIKFKWLYTLWNEQRHKDSEIAYLTLRLNDYIPFWKLLWTKAQRIRIYLFYIKCVILYSVKFAMNKGTTNQKLDIHINFKWLNTKWNLSWTKAQRIRKWILHVKFK